MKKKYKKSKRYYYYRKQKIYGLVIILIGLIVSFMDGNITASIFLTPLGLGLIVTKDRVITDDYFYEMEAKKFDKWKEP